MKISRTPALCFVIMIATTAACVRGHQGPVRAAPPGSDHVSAGAPQPAPAWVNGESVDGSSLCGLGVAGAGFDSHSPYPKELSRERAVRNLAGILGTNVQEAIIDRSTSSGSNQVEMQRALTVDEGLIERVNAIAETEFWLDERGVGPYQQRGFTYAHACINANKAAGVFAIDAAALRGATEGPRSSPGPNELPRWLDMAGTQPGGRVCAVGYSGPTFFKDHSFENVVKDVRGQLARVVETLVSSYYEEFTDTGTQFVEAMTLATTEALASGVIVTHYWYDGNGRGPFGNDESTYGWGCIYPVNLLQSSLAEVEATLGPNEEQAVARVRQRAANAFEELEAAAAKREGRDTPQPPGEHDQTAVVVASDVAVPPVDAMVPNTPSEEMTPSTSSEEMTPSTPSEEMAPDDTFSRPHGED